MICHGPDIPVEGRYGANTQMKELNRKVLNIRGVEDNTL